MSSNLGNLVAAGGNPSGDGILGNPAWHPYLALIKGFRNGLVYGVKIRFPHALVMTFLFRSGTLRERLRVILKATYSHARNLAFFVFIYKSLCLFLKRMHGGKEASYHSFLSGLIGGYLIFGEDNNINNQIVLYLFARDVLALSKFSVKQGILPPPRNKSFSIFAALVWGVVMWIFKEDRTVLQPSLQASMQYLYNDSDVWNSWRNFLWFNR